jgi:hypothetical protein
MGNKVCATNTKLQATHKGHYRTGELGALEKQAMYVLDARTQVMDKHLDGICANLETLHANLNQIQHELEEQTSIVNKVSKYVNIVAGFLQVFGVSPCVTLLSCVANRLSTKLPRQPWMPKL